MKIKARVRLESGSQRTEVGVRSEAAGVFRVRHIRTGLYVSAEASGEGASAAVRLTLGGKPGGVVLPRRKAVGVADAWIAMTGDAGVEIEPAEGDGIPS